MPVRPVCHTRTNLPDTAQTKKRPVRMVARDLGASELLVAHSHEWSRVTYALDGVVRVTVGNSAWIVPPLRAIWIPSRSVHEVTTLETTRLRVLYVHASIAPFRDSECTVLNVSPLLRELIVTLSQANAGETREGLLSALILNELSQLTTLPIRIALPTDKRLKTLCEALLKDPALSFTLSDWAQHVGASERTLARIFEQELKMSFGQWRQQARLAHATPLIARGEPLSQVVAKLGYSSQSAFSAMFKRTFGQSPSNFFSKKSGD